MYCPTWMTNIFGIREWQLVNVLLLGKRPSPSREATVPACCMDPNTTCLSVFLWASSGLCSLISELQSLTPAMTIFRWWSTESVPEAEVWHESRGSTGLVITACKWSLTARGTPFHGTFPYTWAMAPQEKQTNPSWATAISFSSLNCNESLSSISDEEHSKPYKKWALTPQSDLTTNQETMVLK